MSFSFYQHIPGGFVFGSSPGAVTNQARDVPAHNTEQVEPDVEMMLPQETLGEQNSTVASDLDFYMDPLPREMTASPENGVAFQPGAGSAMADEVDGQVATQPPVTPGKHNGMHIELDVDMALPVSPQGASEQSTVQSSSDTQFENFAVIAHDYRASASHPLALPVHNETPTPMTPIVQKGDTTVPHVDFDMNSPPTLTTTAAVTFQSVAGPAIVSSLPQNDDVGIMTI
ncbi:hypothetical protein Hypma_014531 [Hypsizygus marmoreus]|uniref:Uncharacterized protein n=1 Tax=Hypsizygus marmoreus TaxID=39966 RepID=A0A369JJA7_HYPMA|nr:hypothetical protein Hypma_014531 [Hypsizygus marmoreus]